MVLPLPVGPVTKIKPCELFKALFICEKSFFEKPKTANDTFKLLLSKILKTVLSPEYVGKKETLKSIPFFP